MEWTIWRSIWDWRGNDVLLNSTRADLIYCSISRPAYFATKYQSGCLWKTFWNVFINWFLCILQRTLQVFCCPSNCPQCQPEQICELLWNNYSCWKCRLDIRDWILSIFAGQKATCVATACSTVVAFSHFTQGQQKFWQGLNDKGHFVDAATSSTAFRQQDLRVDASGKSFCHYSEPQLQVAKLKENAYNTSPPDHGNVRPLSICSY